MGALPNLPMIEGAIRAETGALHLRTLAVHCGNSFQPLSKLPFQWIPSCVLSLERNIEATGGHQASWLRGDRATACRACPAAGECPPRPA
jgi:hypothetical protein